MRLNECEDFSSVDYIVEIGFCFELSILEPSNIREILEKCENDHMEWIHLCDARDGDI